MNILLKALSDPTRREILYKLRKRDLTAGEIAESFDGLRLHAHTLAFHHPESGLAVKFTAEPPSWFHRLCGLHNLSFGTGCIEEAE